MAKPESPERGVVFDLGAIERELRQEDAYQRSGHTARTMVREGDLRVVLIVMKDGARIPQHTAQETTSIQTTAGLVRLQLPDRTVELPVGHLLVLDGGLAHDVEASGVSAFVLTLGWDERIRS